MAEPIAGNSNGRIGKHAAVYASAFQCLDDLHATGPNDSQYHLRSTIELHILRAGADGGNAACRSSYVADTTYGRSGLIRSARSAVEGKPLHVHDAGAGRAQRSAGIASRAQRAVGCASDVSAHSGSGIGNATHRATRSTKQAATATTAYSTTARSAETAIFAKIGRGYSLCRCQCLNGRVKRHGLSALHLRLIEGDAQRRIGLAFGVCVSFGYVTNQFRAFWHGCAVRRLGVAGGLGYDLIAGLCMPRVYRLGKDGIHGRTAGDAAAIRIALGLLVFFIVFVVLLL